MAPLTTRRRIAARDRRPARRGSPAHQDGWQVPMPGFEAIGSQVRPLQHVD
jgi:hypothetical protein